MSRRSPKRKRQRSIKKSPTEFQGKKTLILQSNMKRCFDAFLYEDNRRALRRARGPCGICGKSYNRTFETDHKKPMAIYRDCLTAYGKYGIIFLAEPDGVHNLQLVCRTCHKEKTKKDMTEIYRVKRLLKPQLEKPH